MLRTWIKLIALACVAALQVGCATNKEDMLPRATTRCSSFGNGKRVTAAMARQRVANCWTLARNYAAR